jgi:predicted metal-dependent RNase
MAKVSVTLANAPIESVILTLTPEEAQALHSLLGNINFELAKKIMVNGDPKILIESRTGTKSLWDTLDDELHKHTYFFKGTIGYVNPI